MFDSHLVVVNVLPALPVERYGRTVLVPLDPSARPGEAPVAAELAAVRARGLFSADLPRHRDTPSFGLPSSCREGEPDPLNYLRSVAGPGFEAEMPYVGPAAVSAALAALEGHPATRFDLEKYRLTAPQAGQLRDWLRVLAAHGLGLAVEFSTDTY